MKDFFVRVIAWLFKTETIFFLPLAGAIIVVVELYNVGYQFYVQTVNHVLSLTIPGADYDIGTVGVNLALINRFIPLHENWNIFVAYLASLIVVVIFRFIKQWIPTLSN